MTALATISPLTVSVAGPARPSAAKSWLRAIEFTAAIERQPTRLLADVIDEWAQATPDNPAMLSDNETFTYGELSSRISRYARWALANGIGKGDTVCLLMTARPDYLAAWLGITRIGGVVALVNSNLIGASLAHCIDVAAPRGIIVADALREALAGAESHLSRLPQVYHEDEVATALGTYDGAALSSSERRTVTIEDRALLIYTSGTTGLPKAAGVSHRRVMSWAGWFAGLADATPDDRLYNCLPVCHSVGGVVATGSMFFAGGAVVIAGKFSATRFWHDIRRWDCTLFQYIGELCRYLLHAPPSEFERQHRLRLCCGNGLRGDIWEAFQERFAIPRILEFYASTEGNFSLYNVEGKVGAIGRIPKYLAHRFPAAIVQFDIAAGEPLRAADGRCIRCAPGEAGEAIGRIGGASEGGGRFDGYTSSAETEKKVLRDVFTPGDAWFRTGDLMTLDAQGYFHFVDRIGDTFRWKGENVAASEVADVLARYPGLIDASVYGVAVAGADGRAGMAALTVDATFAIDGLGSFLSQRLPAYATPVFVRLRPALEITETFKQKKQELIREGFDPRAIDDPLFVRDAASGNYTQLTTHRYAAIAAGVMRL